MLQEIQNAMNSLLGLGKSSLDLGTDEMVIRAGIVYLFTLIVVRFGHKRFLGSHTAFDVVLGIILGSVISRAITGSAAFFPSLAAGLTLVLLHWLLAALAFRSHRLGSLIKGEAQMLVEAGDVQWDNMRSSHISERDFLQALRENASLTDPVQVAEARLERSGDISIIPRDSRPQILTINVDEGIQTVRIKLD